MLLMLNINQVSNSRIKYSTYVNSMYNVFYSISKFLSKKIFFLPYIDREP